MRIIGGRLKRATLHAPKGNDVRPTTDRVREALFNVLQARVPMKGAVVLDLFAGTGALGFEALSRGAARAVFVEVNADVLRVATSNAASLGLQEVSSFTRADAIAWLGQPALKSFDLIFADPPYDFAGVPELPRLVRPHLAGNGLFVLEHDAGHQFDNASSVAMSRAYGRTVISMFAP